MLASYTDVRISTNKVCYINKTYYIYDKVVCQFEHKICATSLIAHSMTKSLFTTTAGCAI